MYLLWYSFSYYFLREILREKTSAIRNYNIYNYNLEFMIPGGIVSSWPRVSGCPKWDRFSQLHISLYYYKSLIWNNQSSWNRCTWKKPKAINIQSNFTFYLYWVPVIARSLWPYIISTTVKLTFQSFGGKNGCQVQLKI